MGPTAEQGMVVGASKNNAGSSRALLFFAREERRRSTAQAWPLHDDALRALCGQSLVFKL